MDRKWIVLMSLVLALVLITGCKKKPPVVEPPPQATQTQPPSTDVPDTTAPAPMVDQQEQKPPMSIQERQQDLESRGLIGDVFFGFDSYDLRADARERLAKNAEFMNSAEGRMFTYTLEGHCDERGTNEYNIALGESRATTAVDYLRSLGVNTSGIRTISYGEERPFCTESTESCWQRNRRARFVITGER